MASRDPKEVRTAAKSPQDEQERIAEFRLRLPHP
jgi:hypothetical protein